jgi:hypothetical protein
MASVNLAAFVIAGTTERGQNTEDACRQLRAAFAAETGPLRSRNHENRSRDQVIVWRSGVSGPGAAISVFRGVASTPAPDEVFELARALRRTGSRIPRIMTEPALSASKIGSPRWPRASSHAHFRMTRRQRTSGARAAPAPRRVQPSTSSRPTLCTTFPGIGVRAGSCVEQTRPLWSSAPDLGALGRPRRWRHPRSPNGCR